MNKQLNAMQQDVEARMRALIEAGYLGSNPPELQRLCIATYRLLLTGGPITRGDIAEATGFSAKLVDALFEMIPGCACEADDCERITAFIGLSVTPARHRLIMDGHNLYTWCAFDALFLPLLLGKPAEIITNCPATDSEIRVRLSGAGLLETAPASAIMSIVAPGKQAYREDLRGSFCRNVNFFLNRQKFAEWKKEDQEIEAISLSDALALAQQRNADRFPDIDPTASTGRVTNK